jgi:hypothetical protein
MSARNTDFKDTWISEDRMVRFYELDYTSSRRQLFKHGFTHAMANPRLSKKGTEMCDWLVNSRGEPHAMRTMLVLVNRKGETYNVISRSYRIDVGYGCARGTQHEVPLHEIPL